MQARLEHMYTFFRNWRPTVNINSDRNPTMWTMSSNLQPTMSLPADALVLIFDEFADEYESLCNVGLACRSWRALSLPSLLRIVDLSCHNNGRLPERECSLRPVVYADYDAAFRPQNLVSRQRAFLRFMVDRPGLAKYVKSLTWTLIWKDFKDDNLSETDRQTWNVFSAMNNVTQLDLASLHQIHNNELVRRNPTRLFPAVTVLRLLGWMHRGLVKAIIASIDTKKLCSLKLEYLQDEGALPNGAPMSFDITEEYAYHARRSDRSDTIDDKLFFAKKLVTHAYFQAPCGYRSDCYRLVPCGRLRICKSR